MKQPTRIWLSMLLLMVSATVSTHAQSDSVEISLLTCAPHHEVYALYGHTAIRIRDSHTGTDVAVNYGIFNFNKPHFVLKFIFGLTDYEMGIVPFDYFRQEYAAEGRQVVEQVLDLTPDEKRRVMEAVAINAMPENKEYRYNFFYDNCTTRARDMIVNHLQGHVDYAEAKSAEPVSFRAMTHRYNENRRWSRFGNDLLLGIKADRKTTVGERQFLPEQLMHDFDRAVVVGADGTQRLLVSRRRIVVEGSPTAMPVSELPMTPRHFGILILLTVVILTWMERKGHNRWQVDAVLMGVTGLAGIVLLAMVFSKHPTVNLNLQILVLNPLTLIFVYPVIKRVRQRRSHVFWSIAIVLILCFFMGNAVQDYAEGMNFLASSLLIRCLANRWRLRTTAQTEISNIKLKAKEMLP